jgi:hypothetical protein
VKHKDLRPWLSVIAGGESLVSHAGGALLVETVRRSGLSGQLSRLLGPWRKPLAVHDPGKIVADMAIAVALGGDAACDIAVLREVGTDRAVEAAHDRGVEPDLCPVLVRQDPDTGQPDDAVRRFPDLFVVSADVGGEDR